MLFKSSKVNEFRLWGLLLTLIGMLIMILGLAGLVFNWGTVGHILAVVFMVLGMLSLMMSMGVYLWAGMMSTNAYVIHCPECGKPTKMIGKIDRCMFCKTKLTVDPTLATTQSEPANEQAQQPS